MEGKGEREVTNEYKRVVQYVYSKCVCVCASVEQTKDTAFLVGGGNSAANSGKPVLDDCLFSLFFVSFSNSLSTGGNYDPMYQSLRGAADARRCAQYVSDGYMASSHEQTYEQQQGNNGNANGGSAAMERNNKNNSGNYHHQQRTENTDGGSSSNNVSMTNINNGHGHGHNSGPLPNHDVCSSISSSGGGGSHRNSEDFIQGCYQQQQQQQQQPPPILRYNNHPNAGYGGNGGNNHELQQRAMHIKQNSPALLSIAQTAHQPYSGRSYLNRHNLNLPKLATWQHRTVHRRKG